MRRNKNGSRVYAHRYTRPEQKSPAWSITTGASSGSTKAWTPTTTRSNTSSSRKAPASPRSSQQPHVAYKVDNADPYLAEADRVIFGPEALGDNVRLAFIVKDDAIIELYEEK